jgi:A/G-specific adenine glycosylase
MDFTKTIIQWYAKNKRELPWRETSNPYHIWVSEVILQQTRVAQGISYYFQFLKEFPSIINLANAPEDEVLKVWQGLGYYTRARNMQKAAKWLVANSNAQLPSEYDELLKIPGLGPYSAGAIASFAFGKPVPAIDGNVYRIISRVFGVFASPLNASGQKEFRGIVIDLMPNEDPATFNQALLDFGALQCAPKGPSCTICPFSSICYAYRNNLVGSLPVKAKKLKVRDRFFTYVIIKKGQYVYIAKRKERDIWHSLYQFPLIETSSPIPFDQLINSAEWKKIVGKGAVYIHSISPAVTHKLSHQTLSIQFIMVNINKPSAYLKKNFIMVTTENIGKYSVPVVIDNFVAAEPFAKYMLLPKE